MDYNVRYRAMEELMGFTSKGKMDKMNKHARRFGAGYVKRRPNINKGKGVVLPPIDQVQLDNQYRQKWRGHLFKTQLSTSLPDLTYAQQAYDGPRKYEKITFSKKIHLNTPPPPRQSVLPLPPINLQLTRRHPSVKFSNALTYTDPVLGLKNATNRTVEYCEHNGKIVVVEQTGLKPTWKKNCKCLRCEIMQEHWKEKDKEYKNWGNYPHTRHNTQIPPGGAIANQELDPDE